MRNNQERLAREWAERIKSVPEVNYGPEANAAAEIVLATTTPPTMADAEWEHEKHHLAGANYKDGSPVVMIDATGLGEIYSIDLGAPHGRMFFPYMGDLIPNGKRYELREITEPEHLVEPSTKTMDEYSPEEQAGMTGMWAEYRRGGEPRDFMIIEGGVNRAGRVPCYNPDAPTPHAWAPDPDELIPRFDLPRVWDKDGQPCEATGSSNEKVVADQPEHPEVLSTVEDYEDAPEGTIVAAPGWDSVALLKRDGKWHRDRFTFESKDMAGDPTVAVLRWGWGE
ncbi:hypothetical protein [Corynebacterium lujinxingii]|uniref:Uncharacterized protein n=1 Tax=Corynebacterium lujinxingii TaxID=2763010 RepID=A0A7H0K0P8_9CORY|nr:hypothetical protein [Corynebacterium lujinxingii]MBC3179392.1 hypothetical protein [Corynebacterium lujinxingii]NNO11499.1 hypothetical protein [Corynebacterium lujinxingii]QNP90864.1 hypothetical protein IAU68_03615 [Corynebacterium lujinxingii]